MHLTKPTLCTMTWILVGSIGTSQAQTRAAACFFANDFESTDALNGWDLGLAVERRTPEGQGLGAFVPAWTVGTATDANAGGYFAVPDSSLGNRFAMANDATAPCNCDMADVSLATPPLDLTGRTGVALECRVFNEGLFEAGPAVIEARVASGAWLALHTLPTTHGAWQAVLVDLSTYDGTADLQLRFRWTDGGTWAGGFAVDDVCLRERNTNDLVVSGAQLGMHSASPYTISDQRMYYRQLPQSQVAPATLSAWAKNGGTDTLHHVQLSGTITLDGTMHGPYFSAIMPELLPGMTIEIPIATGWVPEAIGHATVTITGSTEETDAAPEDNTTTGSVQFTGPGWDNGYSVFSCDNDQPVGSVGGTGGFIIFNRLEVVNAGDQAMGISVRYTNQTQVGAVVRAILLDAEFNMVDTSTQRMLTQADIDGIWNGLPVYESLTANMSLEPGDYHVGIQQLTAGGDLPVLVAVGGAAVLGRSGLMQGLGFTLEHVYTTPHVRLHLSSVPVGLRPVSVRNVPLHVFPNPATDRLHVAISEIEWITSWSLTDMAGRQVLRSMPGSHLSHEVGIDVEDLAPGVYHLQVSSGKGAQSTLIAVHH